MRWRRKMGLLEENQATLCISTSQMNVCPNESRKVREEKTRWSSWGFIRLFISTREIVQRKLFISTMTRHEDFRWIIFFVVVGLRKTIDKVRAYLVYYCRAILCCVLLRVSANDPRSLVAVFFIVARKRRRRGWGRLTKTLSASESLLNSLH